MARKKGGWLVGVDEAGRGPLAGPVTLAVLCIPKRSRTVLRGIKDSKRLSETKREEWFQRLKNYPEIKFGATSVGQDLIDRHGISGAINRGIARLLKRMENDIPSKGKVLLDGSLYAPEKYAQKTVIKGDQKIPVISAASIIAKVTRDKKMKRLDYAFPKYEFGVHKGYGTKAHRTAIKKYGLCSLHRKSFCSKFRS